MTACFRLQAILRRVVLARYSMFRSFPRKRESREIPLGALGPRESGDERKGDPVRPEMI